MKRGRIIAYALAGAVAVSGVGIAAVGMSKDMTPPPPPVAERRYVEPKAPTSKPVAASRPVSISIPVVGTKAPVDVQPPAVDGVLTPPDADRATWLEDRGEIGAGVTDTAYVLGHSAANGGGAFDALVNRETGDGTLLPGDEVLVETSEGTAVYTVQSSTRYERTALADAAGVWVEKPGRLVLVTCLFDANGARTNQNVVVFARLAPESDTTAAPGE